MGNSNKEAVKKVSQNQEAIYLSTIADKLKNRVLFPRMVDNTKSYLQKVSNKKS